MLIQNEALRGAGTRHKILYHNGVEHGAWSDRIADADACGGTVLMCDRTAVSVRHATPVLTRH